MVLVSMSPLARGPSGVLPETLLPFLQKNPPFARGRVSIGGAGVREIFRLRDLLPVIDDEARAAIGEIQAEVFDYAYRISPYYEERGRARPRDHYRDHFSITQLSLGDGASSRPGFLLENDSGHAKWVEIGGGYTPPYAIVRRAGFYGSERLHARLAQRLARRFPS